MTATGLKVWDRQGQLIFDGTSRPPKIIGSIDVTNNGSFTVEHDEENVKVFCFVQALGMSGLSTYPPITLLSGNTITWYYQDRAVRLPVTIFYGIY